MRKLTDAEAYALELLNKYGSACPGLDYHPHFFVTSLNALVKKKRVRIEHTDDGPRYWPLTDG